MEIEKNYIKRLISILDGHLKLYEPLLAKAEQKGDKDLQRAIMLTLDEICCVITYLVSKGHDVMGYKAYLVVKKESGDEDVH